MRAKLARIAAELVVGWVARGIKKRRARKKSAAREADLLRRFTKR